MKRIAIISSFAILVVAVGLLLIKNQSLEARLGVLEASTIVAEKKIAQFERSYCSTDTTSLQQGATVRHAITVGTANRSYQVHTPKDYDPSVKYPVVISFDGIEGSGSRMEGYSGIDALPVIAVYPDSLVGAQGFTAWQGAPYSRKGTDDIAFIKAVLDDLPAKYCIDITRTFAVGMSNGGGFALLAGCELGDRIRAVATVSGAFYSACRNEQHTPSLLVVHSMQDKQVPFWGAANRALPAIPKVLSTQATERHCDEAPARSTKGTVTTTTWSGCRDESILRLVTLKKQPHGWLQIQQENPAVVTTAEYVWDFFEEVMYLAH